MLPTAVKPVLGYWFIHMVIIENFGNWSRCKYPRVALFHAGSYYGSTGASLAYTIGSVIGLLFPLS